MAQVRRLEPHQAESLERLTQHLSAAGGSRFDLAPVDRVLALRPLLLLKLRSGCAPDAARESWREWKAVAATAVGGLGADEKLCVLAYVRACIRHVDGSEEGGKTLANVPTAWKQDRRPEPSSGAEQFPALPTPPAAPAVSSSSNEPKKKGRQRQVLAAWG